MTLRTLLLSCLACTLAACATSPTGRSQLMLMPDDQMDKMGLQAFDNIKGKTAVDATPATNQYVRCVADAITREVGGRWELVVFKDDSANAFALPGGKIGVNTGLLKVATSQGQLATVIGHEVAHVKAHHSNERVSQQLAVQEGINLLSAIATPASGTGQTLMGLLGVGAQYGVLLPFSRIQESEADEIGLQLMARAGFDPRESITLWQNMSRANDGQPPEFLSTHPSHSTRTSDLNRHMETALQLQAEAHRQGKHPACR